MDFSWREVKGPHSHTSSLSWICLNSLFKWTECIMLPEGYSIIYNKYSSECIMHLSCMTDELQFQKWMGNSLRQMSPFSAVLSDKLQLDLNKVSNFMLSNWSRFSSDSPHCLYKGANTQFDLLGFGKLYQGIISNFCSAVSLLEYNNATGIYTIWPI